jgi:hypothetical protein
LIEFSVLQATGVGTVESRISKRAIGSATLKGFLRVSKNTEKVRALLASAMSFDMIRQRNEAYMPAMPLF